MSEAEVGHRDRQLEDAEARAEKQQVNITEQEKNLVEAQQEQDVAVRLHREAEATLETTQMELRSSWEVEMKSKVCPFSVHV